MNKSLVWVGLVFFWAYHFQFHSMPLVLVHCLLGKMTFVTSPMLKIFKYSTVLIWNSFPFLSTQFLAFMRVKMLVYVLKHYAMSLTNFFFFFYFLFLISTDAAFLVAERYPKSSSTFLSSWVHPEQASWS